MPRIFCPTICVAPENHRPTPRRRGQEKFHRVRRQFFLRADQRQHVEIVFNGVPRVILRQRAGDQPAVEPGETFVFVADARVRAGQPRRDAVMDAALRMRVDGKLVTLAPQRPEKSHAPPACPHFMQVFLEDAVHVRIVFQQILCARPHYQRVNRRVGKIRAQLVDERRGDQRVADARQGNDQNFHSREIFSSSAVVDLPGTNGTRIIFPPADSTARRSSWFKVSSV